MKKTHVENNDVQLLARMGRVGVNEDKKMLRASKNAVIGIKTWGKSIISSIIEGGRWLEISGGLRGFI